MLAVMTILCTILWQFVSDSLYDCTDDGFLGFLRPGDWVHSRGNQPVAVVPQVVYGRSMNAPDTIKQGWTITGLWFLWSAFVGMSLIISILFAWLPRQRVRRDSIP